MSRRVGFENYNISRSMWAVKGGRYHRVGRGISEKTHMTPHRLFGECEGQGL